MQVASGLERLPNVGRASTPALRGTEPVWNRRRAIRMLIECAVVLRRRDGLGGWLVACRPRARILAFRFAGGSFAGRNGALPIQMRRDDFRVMEFGPQDGEYEPDGVLAPPHVPSISAERALAAKGDPQARDEVALALFGTWPLPEVVAEAGEESSESVATLCSGYLGRWIRHLFPESFDDALVASTVRFVAEEFEPRVIGKYKAERGGFGDWVRLTVSDLAIQQAVRRFHEAEALAAVVEQVESGMEVPAGVATVGELDAAQRREAQRAALATRQAVQQLIWVQYFFVDPELHPPGAVRLSRAAGWIKDIFDASRIEVRLDECDSLAQEFFMGKILERNILRQFDPAKRSSFNQWIKTAVQNYARDKLTQSAGPPVLSLSDALHAGSHDDAAAEGPLSYGDAPPAQFASETAPATLEAAELVGMTESAVTVPATGAVAESLEPLLSAMLPGILADEWQQALLKLFFGLVLSEADLVVLARERLARWGVQLCLEALGLVRTDPGEALDVPGLQEAKERLREAAALADFEAASEPAPEARNLSEAHVAALERYAYATLTHTSSTPAPTLPRALKESRLAPTLDEKIGLMRRVLMALEHLPAADGGPSVLLATKEALGAWLEEARTHAGLELQEFQSRALRTVNQRQTKLRQLEAKQRQHEPGSREWHELDERMAEVRKALHSKAEELRKRTFGPSDADLGRLLGLEPGAVTGIKSRLLRSVRELLDAERLAEQRRKLSESLRKRLGEQSVRAYEVRLHALAYWRAFPQHAAAVARLQALAPTEAFDDQTAQRYRTLEQQVRHAKTGKEAQAAQARLDELTGALLGRSELEREGVSRDRLLAYEREALRLFTALVALQELASEHPHGG